jgi:hypothetical protein
LERVLIRPPTPCWRNALMSRIAAALTAAAFLLGLLIPAGVSAQVVLECDYFSVPAR